ncbi:hypothetical protein FRX31_019448, partial [Thalictrum thalictroides]
LKLGFQTELQRLNRGGEQDRSYIPDSINFGGERAVKREQKRKAPGRVLDAPPSPPQNKRARKLKASD